MSTIQKLSVPQEKEHVVTSSEDTGWHLDRRVSLAIVFALLTQTGAALLWAGAANERLSHVEMQLDLMQRMNERTTRMEEQVNYLHMTLDRIERKLDRYGDPPDPNKKNDN